MAKVDITQQMIDLIVENKDKKDDDILGLLIQDGVPFSAAKTVLKTVLEEQGLRMSKEERDEKAADMLSSFTVDKETTPDDIAEQIQELVAELDCSAKIARAYIKHLFDEAGVEMPKAPTGGGKRGPRAPGFGGDGGITATYFIENPECTKEEFVAHLVGLGKDKTAKGADKSGNLWNFIEDLRVFAAQWKDAGNC